MKFKHLITFLALFNSLLASGMEPVECTVVDLAKKEQEIRAVAEYTRAYIRNHGETPAILEVQQDRFPNLYPDHILFYDNDMIVYTICQVELKEMSEYKSIERSIHCEAEVHGLSAICEIRTLETTYDHGSEG